ncbi:hypothetical protein Pfo_016321 [Paulownia fortunei]|nr:hypothetical protein Pfo_016321 [Paulownia fortunei]
MYQRGVGRFSVKDVALSNPFVLKTEKAEAVALEHEIYATKPRQCLGCKEALAAEVMPRLCKGRGNQGIPQLCEEGAITEIMPDCERVMVAKVLPRLQKGYGS